MQVKVCYATPEQQWLIPVTLEQGATVQQAIVASGILSLCTELILSELVVGIFSRKCDLATTLREGDRVEIYRPLLLDPKQARLLRAKRKKSNL